MFEWKSFGLTIGIIAGIIITIFVVKALNKDGKFKTRYDEMQLKIRGRAYMYSFWAIVIYEALMGVLTSSETLVLPVTNFVLHISAVLIGVLVQVTYCIWKDAYIGLNTHAGRFAIFSIVIALINLAVAIMAITHGLMYVDGMLQDQFLNLLIAILFIVIGIELLIKHFADRTVKEEED